MSLFNVCGVEVVVRVGLGASEAVMGTSGKLEEDGRLRVVERGRRWCSVYRDAQRIQGSLGRAELGRVEVVATLSTVLAQGFRKDGTSRTRRLVRKWVELGFKVASFPAFASFPSPLEAPYSPLQTLSAE